MYDILIRASRGHARKVTVDDLRRFGRLASDLDDPEVMHLLRALAGQGGLPNPPTFPGVDSGIHLTGQPCGGGESGNSPCCRCVQFRSGRHPVLGQI